MPDTAQKVRRCWFTGTQESPMSHSRWVPEFANWQFSRYSGSIVLATDQMPAIVAECRTDRFVDADWVLDLPVTYRLLSFLIAYEAGVLTTSPRTTGYPFQRHWLRGQGHPLWRPLSDVRVAGVRP